MSADHFTTGGVFRVGGVLGRAWRLFTGDILLFLVASVVIYGSIVIAFVFVFAGWSSGSSGVTELGMVLGRVAVLSLTMVGQGVLLLGAFQRLRGQPLRASEVLETVLSRFMPLLGLSILWSLGLVLPVVGGALVVEMLATGLGLGHEALGLIPAVYAPSAILLVVWTVVVPACVIEGLSSVASMVRSTALTKGYRWKIFGIALLLGLLSVGGEIIEYLVAPEDSRLAILVNAIWVVPLIAYWNATVIMTYHDLRVAKEGVEAGQIADIFD